MKPLLVVGSSGHASIVLEAIELRGEFNVLGLLDSFEAKGTLKHGYLVRGAAEDAAEIAEVYGCHSFVVAIGDNWARWKIANAIATASNGVEFPAVVHPSVVFSKSARIGPGTVVMPAAVVGPNAILGEGCIVNIASVVNHDCRMADYSSLSGGVHLAGSIAIGMRSSVGIGSTIREKVSIGRDSVIGAGTVVLDDIPDEVVAYGVPAKVIRQRAPDERYMR
ncbi:MAG: acetyltransferase [Acidobacteriaceae bacterium]|nr:acetyltransferase [Acidobacteriaceae bacterium]